MDFEKILRGIFIPRYDETLLFMINFAVILLSVFTPFLSIIIGRSFMNNPDSDSIATGIIILLVLVTSLALSVYQLFPSKRKSGFERGLMLALIVIINTVVGYLAWLLIIMDGAEKGWWIMIFPIINFFSSFSLFFGLLTRKLTSDHVSSRDAYYDELIVGCLTTAIVFFICQEVYGLDLLLSFSIMLSYIMLFHRFISLLFAKESDFTY